MPSVLVTGASTGIGRATALRLDRAGWHVLAGVRSEQAAAELAAAASGQLEPLLVDVTDAGQLADAAARVGERLDGLVNNAGVGFGGPLETLPIEDLRAQLEVNVVGQVAATQAMLPALRAAKGRVIFVGSIGGSIALPFTAPYNASKFALEAIAPAFRMELARWGIGVTLVAPGSVATPIWEKSSGQVEALSGSMSDVERELYGDTLEGVARILRKTAERGVAPEEVAAAIETALTAAKPKTRMLVGRDARLQFPLTRVLPQRLLERVVRRQFGL